MPAADALRAPTMATIGRPKTAGLPRTARSGGASSIIMQPARIVRLAQRHQGHAERSCRRELALGILPGADAGRSAGAAATRQVGQGRQRPAGAAVMVDQRAEGPRTRHCRCG